MKTIDTVLSKRFHFKKFTKPLPFAFQLKGIGYSKLKYSYNQEMLELCHHYPWFYLKYKYC